MHAYLIRNTHFRERCEHARPAIPSFTEGVDTLAPPSPVLFHRGVEALTPPPSLLHKLDCSYLMLSDHRLDRMAEQHGSKLELANQALAEAKKEWTKLDVERSHNNSKVEGHPDPNPDPDPDPP